MSLSDLSQMAESGQHDMVTGLILIAGACILLVFISHTVIVRRWLKEDRRRRMKRELARRMERQHQLLN